MNQYNGLLVCAVILLAGCTGAPLQEPTHSVQASPTTTNSPTASEYIGCPFEPQNHTPKEVPDVPEEITSDSVAAYAASHATATVWNRDIASSTHPVNPQNNGFEVSNLNETSHGYLVTVLGFGYEACLPESDGNYSLTVSDSPIYTYLINETAVIRGGASNESRIRKHGTVIARMNGSSN